MYIACTWQRTKRKGGGLDEKEKEPLFLLLARQKQAGTHSSSSSGDKVASYQRGLPFPPSECAFVGYHPVPKSDTTHYTACSTKKANNLAQGKGQSDLDKDETSQRLSSYVADPI